MITIPDLVTSLLDLLHEIKETDISIVVGGGFGIYLKRSTERTLIRSGGRAYCSGIFLIAGKIRNDQAEGKSLFQI